ncbi:MAG: hypothetical protein Q9181_005429 [Wetmoreana brouardii]
MATLNPGSEKPSSSRGSGKAGTKGFHEMQQLKLSYARMFYRDNPQQKWVHIEDSFSSMTQKHQGEPWNVQQVYFTPTGVRVSQFDSPYDPQVSSTGRRDIKVSVYEWRVESGEFSNVTISEYDYDPKYRFAIVEFKYGQSTADPATGAETAATQRERGDDETAMGVENPVVDAGEDAGEKEDIEGGEVAKELGEDEEVRRIDVAGFQMADSAGNAVDLTDPTTFPIARVFSDADACVGKEVRLVFKREPFNLKKPRGRWIWPAVCEFLVGSTFVRHDAGEYNKPLYQWAESPKKRVKSSLIHRAKPFKDNLDRCRWTVSKRTPTQPAPLESPPKQSREDEDENDDKQLQSKIASLRVQYQKLLNEAASLENEAEAKRQTARLLAEYKELEEQLAKRKESAK